MRGLDGLLWGLLVFVGNGFGCCGMGWPRSVNVAWQGIVGAARSQISVPLLGHLDLVVGC